MQVEKVAEGLQISADDRWVTIARRRVFRLSRTRVRTTINPFWTGEFGISCYNHSRLLSSLTVANLKLGFSSYVSGMAKSVTLVTVLKRSPKSYLSMSKTRF